MGLNDSNRVLGPIILQINRRSPQYSIGNYLGPHSNPLTQARRRWSGTRQPESFRLSKGIFGFRLNRSGLGLSCADLGFKNLTATLASST